MKRKGLISILLSLIIVFLFSACNIQKEKDERREDLLAIQGEGNHYFIDQEGYIKDDKKVYFSDLIMKKIEDDGIVYVPDPGQFQSQIKRYDVTVKLFKEIVYFTMRYHVSEDDKVADVIVGYIEIRSEKIVYYNTQITTKEYYGINLFPLMANDKYFLFKQPREFSRKDVYYIIDKSNNVLLEKVSDITPYKDGVEDDVTLIQFNDKTYEVQGNALCCGEETLIIDYEYVLKRSEIMAQIDVIMGVYKKTVIERLIPYKNRLYIVIESAYIGMPFGTGELIPVVFEYDFEKDSFDYIGATDLTWRAGGFYIFGIIPEN